MDLIALVGRLKSWVRTNSTGLSLFFQIVSVAFGAIAIGGVYLTYKALEHQYKRYEEEGFSRRQGAQSLAWKAIGDSNMVKAERGQSDAILYLADLGKLNGRLVLNGSIVTIYPIRKYFDLSKSSFCGTSLLVMTSKSGAVDLSGSLFRGATVMGRFFISSFSHSDLEGAKFQGVRAPSADFIAANLTNVTFFGGSYERSGFQGADLRGVETKRGLNGAGTDYKDEQEDFLGWVDIIEPFEPRESTTFNDPKKTIMDLKKGDSTSDAVYLVDFRHASFTNADLRGADLSNSTIIQAQVDQACSDETTKLPSGVKPAGNCNAQYEAAELRKLLQAPTYRNRERQLEDCKQAMLSD